LYLHTSKETLEQITGKLEDNLQHREWSRGFRGNEENHSPFEDNRGSDQILGPERPSFKQRRKYSYGGIRTSKTKMSSLIHTLKQKGNFNELKQQLNEH
jgi:hypothetical protein